jgi:hypothetical protein
VQAACRSPMEQQSADVPPTTSIPPHPLPCLQAFGATGAMEGAWWMATGESVSFSEQQIMDCSWGYVPDQPWSNAACE